FDSARGLFCNESDAGLSRRYRGREGEQRLDGYVSRARPLVGLDGLGPAKGRRDITHDQLLAGVFRAYPNQRGRIDSILAAYDWKEVHKSLAVDLSGLCSPERADLIRRCLRRRLLSLRR